MKIERGYSNALKVALVTYSALLAAFGPTLIADPFVHYDDVPALLAVPQDFYDKTLTEGRWINYWWHLRGFVTPAAVNFQVYLVGWSLFSAAVSLLALPRSSGVVQVAILAVLIALSPQATLISSWFNTLIPGVWLIAAYATISLYVSPRSGRLLLILFVPLALMTYSTYPFLLLTICLVRTENRSLGDLVHLILLFGLSFALGLAAIYSLNYVEHGVFGIQLADWREAVPLEANAVAHNLGKVTTSLRLTYDMMGHGQPALAGAILALFIGSLAHAGRRDALEVVYLLAGLAVGLALLSIHAFQNGILFPFRSTIFVWVIFAVALGRAAGSYGDKGSSQRALAWCLVVAMTFWSAKLVRGFYAGLASWQTSTADIASGVPETAERMIILGQTASVIDQPDPNILPEDLIFRLALLTGVPAVSCEVSPQACIDLEIPENLTSSLSRPRVAVEGNRVFLALPQLRKEKAQP